MGLWLTVLSFVFLKAPFFDQFFATTEQKLTAYFVLFIWSALFNGFNVRDDGFAIFKGLNEMSEKWRMQHGTVSISERSTGDDGLLDDRNHSGRLWRCQAAGELVPAAGRIGRIRKHRS